MDSEKIYKLSGWQISQKIKEGQLSVKEVSDSFKKRIENLDPGLNTTVSLFDNPELPPENSEGPLKGVPVLVKDNLCIKGKSITCASNILKGFVASYDATVIKRIKDAGLVILGTTNMDEFAFGSSCENSVYGPAKNPWNTNCVPGGSSGGSAAATALGFSPVALGSDTGGSIRQPASFCGVTGFKPTYGRVSRYGLVAFGSSLDQIGPLSRDIKDVAYMLNIISGLDKKDSTSSSEEVPDFSKHLEEDIRGKKIAVPKEYFTDKIDKEVRDKVKESIELLKTKGADFTEINLPLTEYAVSTYYILASSEASSNLSRFDGIRYGNRVPAPNLGELYRKTRGEGFGKEAKRRIMLGTFSLSSGYYEAYYLKALKARSLFKRAFQKIFKSYDAIITPTSPTPAFKLGEKQEDPLSMYLSDICTIPANLSGIPSVSIPCGFTENNLPVGMQLLSNWFSESVLINIAYSYQKSTSWHNIFPEEYE